MRTIVHPKPPKPSVSSVLSLLTALVVALAAAGCTEEDPGGGDIPEGWELVEAAGFTVAVPPGWSVEQGEGTVVDLLGPDAPLDTRVQLRSGVPEGITAAEALEVAVLAMEFELDDIQHEGEAQAWSPAGAEDGALVELSYEQQVDGEPLRIAELTGIAIGQGVQLKVRALDRVDRFDEVRATLQQVLDSVELVGGADPPEQA